MISRNSITRGPLFDTFSLVRAYLHSLSLRERVGVRAIIRVTMM
jgi:hypothetical protein